MAACGGGGTGAAGAGGGGKEGRKREGSREESGTSPRKRSVREQGRISVSQTAAGAQVFTRRGNRAPSPPHSFTLGGHLVGGKAPVSVALPGLSGCAGRTRAPSLCSAALPSAGSRSEREESREALKGARSPLRRERRRSDLTGRRHVGLQFLDAAVQSLQLLLLPLVQFVDLCPARKHGNERTCLQRHKGIDAARQSVDTALALIRPEIPLMSPDEVHQ